MSTLYDLTAKYQQLIEMSEDLDPTLFHDTLDSINDSIEEKAEGYAMVDLELKSIEEKLGEEIKRLQGRKKAISNNRMIMKRNLMESMQATGKTRFKTDKFSFYIRKNAPRLVVSDIGKLPGYLIINKPEADKDRIKKLLKDGTEVSGATLETSESVVIR